MTTIPLTDIAVSSSIIFIAIVSQHFYRHRKEEYQQEKTDQIRSPASFSYVYRFIQLSTLVVGTLAPWFDFPWLLKIHHSSGLQLGGTFVAILGLYLFVTAKVTLGKHYSPCFDSYVPRQMVQEGLYRYIRHPIYLANILLLGGITVATGSVWILLNTVTLAAYYLISATREERALRESFPEYRRYSDNTGMFFPKISARHQPHA